MSRALPTENTSAATTKTKGTAGPVPRDPWLASAMASDPRAQAAAGLCVQARVAREGAPGLAHEHGDQDGREEPQRGASQKQGSRREAEHLVGPGVEDGVRAERQGSTTACQNPRPNWLSAGIRRRLTRGAPPGLLVVLPMPCPPCRHRACRERPVASRQALRRPVAGRGLACPSLAVARAHVRQMPARDVGHMINRLDASWPGTRGFGHPVAGEEPREVGT